MALSTFVLAAILLFASRVAAVCDGTGTAGAQMTDGTCANASIPENATCTYACAAGAYRTGSLSATCADSSLVNLTGTCTACSTAPTCPAGQALNASNCGINGATGCHEICSRCSVPTTSTIIRGSLFPSTNCQTCLALLQVNRTGYNSTQNLAWQAQMATPCMGCCSLYAGLISTYQLTHCIVQWWNTLPTNSFWYPIVAPGQGALAAVCPSLGYPTANYPTACYNLCYSPANPCNATLHQECVWYPMGAPPLGCRCQTGFTMNATALPALQCDDNDECQSNPCHGNATCTNTVGSYTCACNAGFGGDGKTVCDPCLTASRTNKTYVDCGNEYAWGSSCTPGTGLGCTCRGDIAGYVAGTPIVAGTHSYCPNACPIGNTTAYCAANLGAVVDNTLLLQCQLMANPLTTSATLQSRCCTGIKKMVTHPCYSHWLTIKVALTPAFAQWPFLVGMCGATTLVNASLCPIEYATVCSNGVRDYDETHIDCGGRGCEKCSLGATCHIDSDCSNGDCRGYVCKENKSEVSQFSQLVVALPIISAIVIAISIWVDLKWWRQAKLQRGEGFTATSSAKEIELPPVASSAAAASSYGEATEAAALSEAPKVDGATTEEGGGDVYVV